MFRPSANTSFSPLVTAAEANYVIQKNDQLTLEVFTNQGEKIIDPNLESFNENGTRPPGDSAGEIYFVDLNGLVKLPMIGEIKLEGLTIRQAEAILQKEYTRFYLEPFVVLKFTNKRVVVLGTTGGTVIPLTSENTRLTEVLALSKAISNEAKANNIRVMRAEKIFEIDLSTINGYLKSDIIMQPGDIVYVEPVRRPFSEGLREYGPVISIITSVGTLIIVILQLEK
jgi:polysaccharide export outer membrane protein